MIYLRQNKYLTCTMSIQDILTFISHNMMNKQPTLFVFFSLQQKNRKDVSVRESFINYLKKFNKNQ